MATAIVEETKDAPDFLARLITVLNDGMLCLAISIGHQTGLFDTMADAAKATSADIAKRAGLNERYVREWLGAMVTGRIVDYDAATKAYTLPPERSVFITRAAGIDNLAVQAQYVALLGSVESQIEEARERPIRVERREHARQ